MSFDMEMEDFEEDKVLEEYRKNVLITGVSSGLGKSLKGLNKLDVVILNAGILGDIKTFDKWSYNELQEIMDVNVWANKRILDYLFKNNIEVKQVICISSGASEHTYKGWSGYSLSKSSLRMMMEVYSKEVEDTHFMSVAPGLVDTQMQDYLRNKVDVKEFPSSSYFIESKENGMTKSPDEIAKKIIKLTPTLLDLKNGSFIDLRNL